MSKKVIWIGALLLCTVLAQGQFLSRLGRFQVDEIKGCAPFTVTITNLFAGSCIPSSECFMDFLGNGQGQPNQFTFTYPTPGTFKLSVVYQNIGADDITITVDENIPPAFDIYTCANNAVRIKVLEKSYDQLVIDFTGDGIPETIIPSGNNAIASHAYPTSGSKAISVRGRDLNSADNCMANVQNFNALLTLPAPTITRAQVIDDSSIQLDFSLQPNIQYRLEIAVNGNTNFQLVQVLDSSTEFIMTNLKTNENFYCFRVSAFDPCNNTNTFSNTICSLDFDLLIQSGVNKLSWATATAGIQSISINRTTGTETTLITRPGASLNFDDIDVLCKLNYCYTVTSRYAGGVESISLEKCGLSFKINSPPAVINVSSVINQGVELEWPDSPPSNPPAYFVLRAADRKNFFQIATSPTSDFTDPAFTPLLGLCYKINYDDECDNKSPEGIMVCPVELQGTLDNKNMISLQWNSYLGWNSGVKNYLVEKFDQDGALIGTINNGLDTVFVDDQPDPANQVVTYRITAMSLQSGIPVSQSNDITFTKQTRIFAPTAFSPNNDNLNDLFQVSGQFIQKMELYIFNRWGEMVYESDSGKPWNGTRNGQPAQEDAYVWTAQITDRSGRTFKENGTIILLRKK